MNISKEAIEILEGVNFASLATINIDGSPQVSVVWIDYKDNHILINTAKGRIKTNNIQYFMENDCYFASFYFSKIIFFLIIFSPLFYLFFVVISKVGIKKEENIEKEVEKSKKKSSDNKETKDNNKNKED